jgi:hypothetical protein
MNLSAEERDAEQEFFACRVCGVACAIAPVPPGRAVCEDHCEDHEYDYDPHRRDKFCRHCDRQIDPDYWWYD